MRNSVAVLALVGAASLAACRGDDASPSLARPFESPPIRSALLEIAPPGWSLTDSKKDQIPWGHHNTGYGGELLIFTGPEPVYFLWRDTNDVWHREPLARESLELWIMPAFYRPAPKPPLEHHPVIPPELVFKGNSGVVYGRSSHVITSDDEFNALLRQAKATGWSDIANKELSWADWESDIERFLTDKLER